MVRMTTNEIIDGILKEDRIDTAKILIKLGKLSAKEIAQCAKIPVDLVKELACELKENK